jgi:hypothetical protein
MNMEYGMNGYVQSEETGEETGGGQEGGTSPSLLQPAMRMRMTWERGRGVLRDRRDSRRHLWRLRSSSGLQSLSLSLVEMVVLEMGGVLLEMVHGGGEGEEEIQA